MKTTVYNLLQWTWGLPQTLIGALIFLMNRKQPHYSYHGSRVTVWKSKSSLSMGAFVFVTDDPFFYYDGKRAEYTCEAFRNMLLVHEYGHTLQSLIFGPLYLLAVGVPSVAWSFWPPCVKKREREHISYFSVYPERWANRLGERFTKDASIGEPV